MQNVNTVTIDLDEYLELKEFKKNILNNKTIRFGLYGRTSIYAPEKTKELIDREIEYIESQWKKEVKKLEELNNSYFNKIESQKKEIESLDLKTASLFRFLKEKYLY